MSVVFLLQGCGASKPPKDTVEWAIDNDCIIKEWPAKEKVSEHLEQLERVSYEITNSYSLPNDKGEDIWHYDYIAFYTIAKGGSFSVCKYAGCIVNGLNIGAPYKLGKIYGCDDKFKLVKRGESWCKLGG